MAYQDVEKQIRECKKCGEVKAFNQFIKDNKCTHGIKWTCLECKNKKRRKNVFTDQEKYDISNDLKKIRKCRKCGEVKSFSKFARNTNCRYKITFTCKECNNKYVSMKHKENPSKRRSYSNRYRENNLTKVRGWKKTSEDKNRDSTNNRRRMQYRDNPQKKIAQSLRGSLRDSIKIQNAEKRNKTLDLIGCTINYFCKHIEKQFDENMSWENQGTYWHLDHIFPISKADLTKESEIKKVMHYTNFQPLEAIENIKKGAKLNWRGINNENRIRSSEQSIY